MVKQYKQFAWHFNDVEYSKYIRNGNSLSLWRFRGRIQGKMFKRVPSKKKLETLKIWIKCYCMEIEWRMYGTLGNGWETIVRRKEIAD